MGHVPKSAFQSPSSYVQQYVGEGVELCSPHNLHDTNHMKINKPRIGDLQFMKTLFGSPRGSINNERYQSLNTQADSICAKLFV